MNKKQLWPGWRYHKDFPEGKIFNSASEVPEGAVSHPKDLVEVPEGGVSHPKDLVEAPTDAKNHVRKRKPKNDPNEEDLDF